MAPAEEQLRVLSQLFIATEHLAQDLAQDLHVTKVKSLGTALVFYSTGSTSTNESDAWKVCQLAVSVKRMLEGFKSEREFASLKVKSAITMGPVITAIVGLSRPKFDIFGSPITVAEKLVQLADPGTIMTTKVVAKQEKDKFIFKSKKTQLVAAGKTFVPFVLVPNKQLQPIFPK